VHVDEVAVSHADAFPWVACRAVGCPAGYSPTGSGRGWQADQLEQRHDPGTSSTPVQSVPLAVLTGGGAFADTWTFFDRFIG
jgi:hypothetical protein